MQKLRNVDNALNFLREERVKLSDQCHAAAIVDGEAAGILGLCWSIILHWQFYQVLQQSSSTSVKTLENLLLKWCQLTSNYSTTSSQQSSSPSLRSTPTPTLNSFTRPFADGLLLCQILHHFKPNLVDLDNVRAKSPRERLDFVFAAMKNHYGVPPILDPEDVHALAADKKVIMTYVMSMFEALPHDLEALQASDEGSMVVETVQLGSPLKSHLNLKSGTALLFLDFMKRK